MDPLNTKGRIFAAHKLLLEKTTSKEKFESIRTLLKGINPHIDTKLEQVSQVFQKIEQFKKGEVIDLTTEHLPEKTEEEIERKKLFLLLLRNWKQLHKEVDRVKKEFEIQSNSSPKEQIISTSRILGMAKGPFGLVTAAAIVIVVASSFLIKSGKPPKEEAGQPKAATMQVIEFQGKQIPLTELKIGKGPECLDTTGQEAPHYHAVVDTFAKDRTGQDVADPGVCGFGKVTDTKVVEVSL